MINKTEYLNYEKSSFIFEYGNTMFVFDADDNAYSHMEPMLTRIKDIFIFSSRGEDVEDAAMASLVENLISRLDNDRNCVFDLHILKYSAGLTMDRIAKSSRRHDDFRLFDRNINIITNDGNVFIECVADENQTDAVGYIIMVDRKTLYYTGKVPKFDKVMHRIKSFDYILYSKENAMFWETEDKELPSYWQDLERKELFPYVHKFIPAGGFTENEYKWFLRQRNGLTVDTFKNYTRKVVTTD